MSTCSLFIGNKVTDRADGGQTIHSLQVVQIGEAKKKKKNSYKFAAPGKRKRWCGMAFSQATRGYHGISRAVAKHKCPHVHPA